MSRSRKATWRDINSSCRHTNRQGWVHTFARRLRRTISALLCMFFITDCGGIGVSSIAGHAQLDAVLLDLDGTLLPSAGYRELRHGGGGNAAVASLLDLRLQPYPGVETMLARLSSALKMGVVTSAPRWYTETLLNEHFPEIRIDTVVTYDDVRRLKPDPEPVILALDRLAVRPERSVYIGDQPEDMQAAHTARVAFIGAAWGEAELPAGVNASTPMSVLDLLGYR